MASSNTKIVITEFDTTKPTGAGSSSDIPYIPGFAVDIDYDGNDVREVPAVDEYGVVQRDADGGIIYTAWAPVRNRPVLCNTVQEFEDYFGRVPYQLTEKDIMDAPPAWEMHTFYKVGDYDRSYIYAKELLKSGMSVLYENVRRDEPSSPSFFEEAHNYFSTEDVEVLNTNDTLVPEEGSTTKLVFTKGNPGETSKLKFTLDFKQLSNAHITVRSSDGNTSYTIVDSIAKAIQQTDHSITVVQSAENAPIVIHTTQCAVIQSKVTVDVQLNTNTSFELFITSSTPSPYDSIAWNDVIYPEEEIVSRIYHLYDTVEKRMTVLENKNEYSVKYITSGGYPSFNTFGSDRGSVYTSMIKCAANRGDAVALIDPTCDYEASLGIDDASSFYKMLTDAGKIESGEYGAAFTPWGKYTCSTVPDMNKSLQIMPPSYGYMKCLANAIKSSPNWLAMAGVTRGLVPGLSSLYLKNTLTNVIAEDYQPKFGDTPKNRVSLNAITTINPYGLTLWGNRTLKQVDPKGCVALNFLNTRNMISDIKKVAYSTAKALMFEQDSDTLWLNFKSGISPLLEQLKSGFGISDYKIIRSYVNHKGQPLTKGEIAAVIKIFPLYAVEFWDISVVIADSEVTVS